MIKKGQIIVITSGEYHEYGILGQVRAKRDFEETEEIARFVNEGDWVVPSRVKGQSGKMDEHGSDQRFYEWLIGEGVLERVGDEDVLEWYVGSSQRVDIGDGLGLVKRHEWINGEFGDVKGSWTYPKPTLDIV